MVGRIKGIKNLTTCDFNERAKQKLKIKGFMFLSSYYDSTEEVDVNQKNLKILYCCEEHPEIVKCSRYTSVVGKGVSYCVRCNLIKLEQQYLPKYKLKIDELCRNEDLTFIRFGEYQGADTRVFLKCNGCGNEMSPTYEAFTLRKNIKSRGCGNCKIKNSHLSKSEIQAQKYLAHLKGCPDGYRITRNIDDGSKWDCWCPVCSEDEYTKAGLCTGTFTVSNSQLFQGRLPCRCGNGENTGRLTQEQKEFKVKNICDKEGLKFLSLVNTSVNWKCKNNHICTTKIYRFIGENCRCKKCNLKFNTWAYFYIVRWFSDDGKVNFIKLGITGKTKWIKRIYKQRSESKLKYEILYVFKGSGREVFDAEYFLKYKSDLKLSVVNKKTFPDGYTETFVENELDFVLKTLDRYILISIYKNKEVVKLLTENSRKTVNSIVNSLGNYDENIWYTSEKELTKEDWVTLYTKTQIKSSEESRQSGNYMLDFRIVDAELKRINRWKTETIYNKLQNRLELLPVEEYTRQQVTEMYINQFIKEKEVN